MYLTLTFVLSRVGQLIGTLSTSYKFEAPKKILGMSIFENHSKLCKLILFPLQKIK